MAIASWTKDPGTALDPVALDYQIDWSDWLAGDTIASSVWTVPTGINQGASSNTSQTTTIRLSGGTQGVDYECVNYVTTASGQSDERSIIIQVRQVEGSTSDATDRSSAILMLTDWVPIEAAPVLEQSEVEGILDRHKVASTWTPSTAYQLGQRLLPPTRNGCWYEVVQPGTSQSETRTYFEWPTSLGDFLSDGDSEPQLLLEVGGSDSLFRATHSNPTSVNVYDVRAAAKECWQLKSRRASQFIDTGDVKMSQVYSHCLDMAGQLTPINWPCAIVRG